MEAHNGAVFVHLFHDLIVSGCAKVAFLLLKHDFEEVLLTIVPDGYVVFRGHNIMPFLMESVMLGARSGLPPLALWGALSLRLYAL